MNSIASDIEVVAKFKKNENPIPIKFKIVNSDGSFAIIKIDKILSSNKENLAGLESFVYNCQSEADGESINYQIRFFLRSCTWKFYGMKGAI